MHDLFDKCHTPKLQEYEIADSMGLIPFFKTMGSESGPTVVHEGREVLMLGSNNYLGLTGDERVKRAAIEAVEQYGTGCTGSRLMNGTLPLHHELEEELCDWLGAEAGIVFTTGYSVNLGVISTLVGPRDAAFVDVSGHASIIDGARLAPGSFRYFRHNSVSSLGHRLKVWQQEGGEGALVAVDGIYSMEGDVAPVGPMADTCREYGARLLVDEAHALGVIGPKGAGVAADAGVEPDLLMGTFSKSLASCGGFILGSKAVVDYVRIACRPFQFTASGVPAALGAALAALRVAREEDWRRVVVRERADQL
ncbi:MAG TPA: aminotransferase class I/II-fold pyridoxal phosphate-dependent enzyme, partial [Acidimicrobiales bacterium]|nr:aminotransferase class I/II-fold pyridoxal phosphate-dependent enzyme [Acidimicrobiales bacterium]